MKAPPWHEITTTARRSTWAAWHLAPQQFSRGGYRIAEIGVWKGENALTICKAFGPQLGVFYLIDNYSSCPESRDPKENYAMALELLEPWVDTCHWLLGDSVEMAKLVPDRSLDFAYIDATHTKPEVRRDIKAWSPKIRPGGILGGHDIEMPDVYLAVHELLNNVITHHRDWWVYL